jgi:hypothetical protein
MKIPKPAPDDLERFRAAVPDDPRVEVKPMFGNLGAFCQGNMFMGLFGADIGVKLAPDDAAALRKLDGAGSFGPAERPMGGYVTLPPSIVGTAHADRWIGAALRHALTLPPKPTKGATRSG